jgi:hypothetical protein
MEFRGEKWCLAPLCPIMVVGQASPPGSLRIGLRGGRGLAAPSNLPFGVAGG